MTSTIWQSVQVFDPKRTVAHVFPGFLLFLGILMTSDSISMISPNFTSIVLNASTSPNIEILVIIGLFLGGILGIMIDGISHLIFEDLFFRVFMRNINKKEEMSFKAWMNKFGIIDDLGKPRADYLYPKVDSSIAKEVGWIKDTLVRDFYSFYEFYINSSLSLFILAFIIPKYMEVVFKISTFYSSTGFSVILVLAVLLMAASVNTLKDYKKARIAIIDGILTTQSSRDTKQ
jgi:hypothetical protein